MGRSFWTRMTKTRWTIARTERDLKASPIFSEDYLRNEMSKVIQPQTEDVFNELVDLFAELHKHKHPNEM